MREYIHEAMERTATAIAESAGGSVEFAIDPGGTSAVINDPALTERMMPSLKRVSGGRVASITPQTVAEDFAEFQKVTPGLYVFLGSFPEGVDPARAPQLGPGQ